MPRLFISRLLETFFRRWWLYLLPIVLLFALGVASTLTSGSTYRSNGIVLVSSSSLLADLSGTTSNPFGQETPAAYTSRQVNTLLQTDQFLDLVVKNAGLTEAMASGAVTRQSIRKSIFASATGDALVSVATTSSNPELSFRLAQSTIDSFTQFEVEAGQADSASAVDELTRQIEAQQQVVSDAADVTALQDARAKLEDYQKQLEQAKLVGDQAGADVAQRLRVIDTPIAPTAPESNRKADIQTVALFLALGVLVSVAALVVVTLMDHSVRYGEEIEAKLHLPVLATVPESPAALKPHLA